MSSEVTLRQVRRTNLFALWPQLLGGPYDDSLRETAIKLIVFFVTNESEDLNKLGHRLALLYTKHTGDYSAVHAVASMKGLVPLVVLSERLASNAETQTRSDIEEPSSFISEFREAFRNSLREGDMFLTAGQRTLQEEFRLGLSESVSIVAPTSYGKSSLISKYIEATQGSLCVLVPTKSLLAQTRRMLLHDLDDEILNKRKIVTHHDMVSQSDDNILAILTQERLLRLFQNQPDLCFSHLFVDESHNLFADDERSRALASAVIIAKHRKADIRIKFLSPFIVDPTNLENRVTKLGIVPITAGEYIKSELIYLIDFRENEDRKALKHKIFDQFINQVFELPESFSAQDEFEYVRNNSGNKNIIYLNRPIHTHVVAERIGATRNSISSRRIEKACKDIGDYLHNDYKLINYLRTGIVVHHGSIPENVRLYLEHIYSTIPEVRYVVTTSTLLEGVNLPAEKMFLLDIKKGRKLLTDSQLKNLIGRVARFKEVFSGESIDSLLPSIHFVGNNFYPKRTRIEEYLQRTLREDVRHKDIVENPMLQNSKLDKDSEKELRGELAYLLSAESDIETDPKYEPIVPQTEFGKVCILHRINDSQVFVHEVAMQQKVTAFQRMGVKVRDEKGLIEAINEIVFSSFPEDTGNPDIDRLRNNVKARDFYAMILGWRTKGYTYKQMITAFLKHWGEIESDPTKCVIYAGSWGDRPRDITSFTHDTNYLDISQRDHAERVTLAIARIEAEMNFLDFNVMRYIECLKDIDLIEEEYLDKLKFGTSDKVAQQLIQAGMSHSLARVLRQGQYLEYVQLRENGAVRLLAGVEAMLEKANENSILIHEARYYIK